MCTDYKEVLEKYIWESTTASGAQAECWINIRKFVTKKYGIKSLLVIAIDLLHHPYMSYHERLFKKTNVSLTNLDTFDLWELAEEANLAKDLHETEDKRLFIPRIYFYDIKSFFLDIMLFRFFLKDAENVFVSELDKANEFITLKKKGLTLMITRENKLLLINLEKGNRTFFDGLHRGIHVPIKKLDFQMIHKIKSFGLNI